MKEKWISRSTSFEFLMQICSENYLSWFRDFIPTVQINFVMCFAWKSAIQISLVNPIYFRLGIKFSFSLFCMNKYCYIIYLLFLNRAWKNKFFKGKYSYEKGEKYIWPHVHLKKKILSESYKNNYSPFPKSCGQMCLNHRGV
jgi:hypothetical protein